MSPREVADFAAHLVQLAMHAGHSLSDVLPAVPDAQQAAVRQMREAARSFYRATQDFSRHVQGSSEL